LSLKQKLLKHRLLAANGCWEYQGARRAGYGIVNHDYTMQAAHRLSAHVFLGFDLDSPMVVMHKCHNRACFNPEHLRVGTQSENLYDKKKKGVGGVVGG
jgi:Autographiviridae HNH endonuclease